MMERSLAWWASGILGSSVDSGPQFPHLLTWELERLISGAFSSSVFSGSANRLQCLP